MFEIKGKVNTAVCYGTVVEQEAIDQIRRMCDYEFTENSRIRIMPDVHAGKGCTIGTTMTVTDKVVLNIVGVDIGCGMYTVCLGKQQIDMERLDQAAHYIPSGMRIWEGRQERFDLEALRCYRSLRNTKWLERSLGTLGGGNHFIEVDQAGDGTRYLVIHTGSRNLGKQVADLYQRLAVELHKGKETYFRQRDEIIRVYKEQGRRKEIQAALKALAWQEREVDMPEDLCYLYGSYMEDYLHDVEICQQFARRNRERIAQVLLEQTGMTGTDGFHTVHNYIEAEEFPQEQPAETGRTDGAPAVGSSASAAGGTDRAKTAETSGSRVLMLRKGAIAARKGEKVLIPINMRDGSVLAVGKGNPAWNQSAPHGAGRLMSRTQAKSQLTMEEYRREMAGVYTTSVSEGTLDEAPMAYKSLEDIIDVIHETTDIIDIMKPIYNFKAE